MGPGLQMRGGQLQRIPPTASQSEMATAINDVIDRLNGQLKTQVFSDGTTKRMIIGYQKDGWGVGKDFGIKVSIEGVDVTQATDAELLMKYDLQTWFYYEDGLDVGQVGLLPNGRNGEAWSKDGESVSGAFGG